MRFTLTVAQSGKWVLVLIPSPSTLSRNTILASSNSGSVVSFSAGQKTIWCDYPAGKAVYLDASGSISEPIVNISGITGHIGTADYVAFDTSICHDFSVLVS